MPSSSSLEKKYYCIKYIQHLTILPDFCKNILYHIPPAFSSCICTDICHDNVPEFTVFEAISVFCALCSYKLKEPGTRVDNACAASVTSDGFLVHAPFSFSLFSVGEKYQKSILCNTIFYGGRLSANGCWNHLRRHPQWTSCIKHHIPRWVI